MDTFSVKRFVEKNQIVMLKADKTQEAPEVDALLDELGNTVSSLQFYAVFPADRSEPILFGGPITKRSVLEVLQRAGPSQVGKRIGGGSSDADRP